MRRTIIQLRDLLLETKSWLLHQGYYYVSGNSTPLSKEYLVLVLAVLVYLVCRYVVNWIGPVKVWAGRKEDHLIIFLCLTYLVEPAESFVPAVIIFVFTTLFSVLAAIEIYEKWEKEKEEDDRRSGS